MEPKPGSFYDEEEASQEWPAEGEAFPPLEPETNGGEVRRLQMICDALSLAPEVVYYPCCANDASPSAVFAKSKVIYCDIRDFAIAGLTGANLDAHCASALEFNPGPVDVLILFNQEIEPAFPAQFVKPGGVVICNDFHNSASAVSGLPNFELIGVANSAGETEFFDTENLEEYLQPIESDAQWKAARASASSDSYESARHTVVSLGEDPNNVFESYQRLVARARAEGEQLRVQYPGRQFPLAIVANDQAYFINEKLPWKKGTADDYYVFRKKQ